MGISATDSAANLWGLGTSKIPAGIIRDMSITTSSISYVYLTALTVDENTLSLSLVQGGKIVAYGSTDEEGSVLFLKTEKPCISALIEVGSFKGLHIKHTDPVRVNDARVLVVPQEDTPSAIVAVRQDGVQEQAVMREDYELVVDPKFTTSYNTETKTLSLSLSDEDRRSLVSLYVEVEQGITRLTTINHVRPDDDGVVYLTVINKESELGFTQAEKIPMITISSSLTPCVVEDTIDKHISPENVRSYSYLPLDDAYVKDPDSGDFTRSTIKTLSIYNKLDSRYDSVNL